MVDRLGIRIMDTGVAEVDHRADVLNSSNSIQGGVLAFVAEVAAQSLATEHRGPHLRRRRPRRALPPRAPSAPRRRRARVLQFSETGATVEVETRDRGADNRTVSYVVARCAALDG